MKPKHLLPSLALALAAPAALAGGFTVQGGKLDDITRYSVGYTADPIYENGNFQILPVYELARFHRDRDDAAGGNRTLYQVSAVPMLRYRLGSSWYVEGGIGVSLFNHTRIGDKRISTAFQFSDHIGFGMRINRSLSIAYRFSHFSNASIRKPNPGINSQSIVLTMSY
ncbi:MAG: acyloxyacyl hydrolase [Burkholderiaceae bacterium]